MANEKSNYVLESRNESERLDRQSKMAAFDFKLELQFLKVSTGQKILDAGCGTGIVSNYLSTLAPGVKVVGLDFSANQIEAAKAKYGAVKNISFDQKSLLEPLDVAGGRFDTIVCRFVLRHFSSIDSKRVIQNLYGALKPGGTIYCLDVEGILGEIFPSSPFLKKAITRLNSSDAVDFGVAKKMPSLLINQGFKDVDWHVMSCLFKGEALSQEVHNLRQSIKNAEAFAKNLVGGESNFARFQKEYFAALQEPGCVLNYNKVVAMGTKPKAKAKLKLIT